MRVVRVNFRGGNRNLSRLGAGLPVPSHNNQREPRRNTGPGYGDTGPRLCSCGHSKLKAPAPGSRHVTRASMNSSIRLATAEEHQHRQCQAAPARENAGQKRARAYQGGLMWSRNGGGEEGREQGWSLSSERFQNVLFPYNTVTVSVSGPFSFPVSSLFYWLCHDVTEGATTPNPKGINGPS